MGQVGCGHGVLVFCLEHQNGLGDQCLEYALVYLVARKEGFVGENEYAISQVPVEISDKVLWVGYVDSVLAPGFGEPSPERAFAGSFLAAQYNGNLPSFGGL